MNNTFKFHAYLIECLTNMHVGSGDSNYGIVDKQVQRDAITNTPVINASSLKGAIREYFEESVGWKKKDSKGEPNNDPNLDYFFGSDKGSQELKQGALRFFEAHLLSIPIRGIKEIPYYRATADFLLDDFNRQVHEFSCSVSKLVPIPDATINCFTEYGDYGKLSNSNYLGENAINVGVKMNEEILNSLPIMARNSLENGQSENLWYEEIIPRESRFYFFLAVPEACKNFDESFNNLIDKKIVQIGANASIGYGFCKLSKIF